MAPWPLSVQRIGQPVKTTSLACVFSTTKTPPRHILTRQATGCDISTAARMLHVFNPSRLASLANLTRHGGRVVGLGPVGWSSKCVSLNQVPVFSVDPTGPRLRCPSRFQYCIPRSLQCDCKCGLRCTKQPSSSGHEWLVRPAWAKAALEDLVASCGLGKLSLFFWDVSAACSHCNCAPQAELSIHEYIPRFIVAVFSVRSV